MQTQKERLVILIIYMLALFCANYLAFGVWLPESGGRGLWFHSGLLSILLGSLLVTPYYTKPVDAFSYATAAIITLYASNNWGAWNDKEKVFFTLVSAYCVLTLLFALISIVLKDAASTATQRIANTTRYLADAIGDQKIFSLITLFAIIIYHRFVFNEFFILMLAWALLITLQPGPRLIKSLARIKEMWSSSDQPTSIGEITAYQAPNIVLVRQKGSDRIKYGTTLLFKDEHAPTTAGIALDYIGRDEGLLLRAIDFEIPEHVNEQISRLLSSMPPNTAARISPSDLPMNLLEDIKIVKHQNEFIGIVAPDTSVETLYIEVINERDIEEGKLVEVQIRNSTVLYQIIDGITKEEVVHQKNTFGYAKAKAKKIGNWIEAKSKFTPAKWLPRPNTPVYIKAVKTFNPTRQAVGHFPSTSYPAEIKSIHHLVTHNTAILGILGVGKSMLSIELVERMISEKIKVICLDLTDQYAKELKDLYDEKSLQESIKSIKEAGEKDKAKWDEDPEKGGSLQNLSQAIYSDLDGFIKDEKAFLKIYNPAQFSATKQLNEPKTFQVGGKWNRQAALWSISPVEITRIVSETTLALLQDKMTDTARACLVYEEAHSLVPEWNSVVNDGDKEGTNGTARAILQGRKYGLGCLLITQRTANVTKTILNQCNTIFAMRTFDETGKEFLSNYIGRDYASALPTLEERHAVFFGKASSCENPVLIRLNDRDQFKEVFREKPRA